MSKKTIRHKTQLFFKDFARVVHIKLIIAANVAAEMLSIMLRLKLYYGKCCMHNLCPKECQNYKKCKFQKLYLNSNLRQICGIKKLGTTHFRVPGKTLNFWLLPAHINSFAACVHAYEQVIKLKLSMITMMLKSCCCCCSCLLCATFSRLTA